MSYAEYLDFEARAETKHEYVNGRVYAMSGGTIEHARLAMAVGAELKRALGSKRCVAYSSDLRIRILGTGRSTYPDVSVICGRAEHAPDDRNAAVNPTVIVEVLSEGTENSDRGDKWAHYQRIPSLREYVLVSQTERRIEVYSRDPEQAGLWHYREHGPGGAAGLPSLEIALDVDAVYASPLADG